MRIRPSKYVEPLFKETFYEADLWGGRGRGGSHNMTLHAFKEIVTSTYFRGFFVRAILGSVRDSLWQDFKDRIEEISDLNNYDYSKDFAINENEMKAIHLPTGNQIKSKGFKASSKGNTANMKSLAGATHVYIEECEEVGEMEYNKLADSLRTIKSPVRIIRSWNPPPKEHWLVQQYYYTEESKHKGFYKLEPKGVDGHISMFGNYLLNIKNLDSNTLARYKRYKETNPKYYYNQILGLVSDGGIKKVYNNWRKVSLRDYLNMDYTAVYGLDIGDISPNALCEIKYNDGVFYTHEILYKSSRQLKEENSEVNVGILVDEFERLGVSKEQWMVVDKAAKDAIQELHNAGYNVVGADKSPGSVASGIEFINRANNFYTDTSVNLENEYDNYYLEEDQYKAPIEGKPIKRNDHLMDADRYGKSFMRIYYDIVL